VEAHSRSPRLFLFAHKKGREEKIHGLFYLSVGEVLKPLSTENRKPILCRLFKKVQIQGPRNPEE
jgi:hypothetical protein